MKKILTLLLAILLVTFNFILAQPVNPKLYLDREVNAPLQIKNLLISQRSLIHTKKIIIQCRIYTGKWYESGINNRIKSDKRCRGRPGKTIPQYTQIEYRHSCDHQKQILASARLTFHLMMHGVKTM